MTPENIKLLISHYQDLIRIHPRLKHVSEDWIRIWTEKLNEQNIIEAWKN